MAEINNDPQGRQTALVADATLQGRAFFQAVLTLLGYQVMTAGSGLEALRLAQETGPDLMLLDGHLPELSLKEVAARLRGGPASTSVVLLGGPSPTPPWVDAVLSHRATWGEITGCIASLGEAREKGKLREEALLALARAVEIRDPYTQGHMERVALLARTLARLLGLSAHEQERLRRAGLLHDVGKVGLHRAVLNKEEPLTPEEWRAIKEHPALGERICQPLGDPQVLQVVRHHHEHFSGEGYPDGLAGEAIPLWARLLAVADAYDALTSHRPQRRALSSWAALQVIRREAGRHFDPEVAFTFIEGVESQAIPPSRAPTNDCQKSGF